jgi:hypothetical protein
MSRFRRSCPHRGIVPRCTEKCLLKQTTRGAQLPTNGPKKLEQCVMECVAGVKAGHAQAFHLHIGRSMAAGGESMAPPSLLQYGEKGGRFALCKKELFSACVTLKILLSLFVGAIA